jgi:hypothetical protein
MRRLSRKNKFDDTLERRDAVVGLHMAPLPSVYTLKQARLHCKAVDRQAFNKVKSSVNNKQRSFL